MKEFIDKLIERLEERKEKWFHIWDESINNGDCDDYADGMNDAFIESVEIVNQLAEEYKLFGNSEQVKGGWIPLTKQLPEYGQYVLACIPPKKGINGGHPVVIMKFMEDNEPLFYRFVSAWMPLPAPYTEGE